MSVMICTGGSSAVKGDTNIPKSSYRLPVFCVVSFLNCDLSLLFRAQVRHVVGLLIVLSKNVPHIIIDKFLSLP